MSRITVIIEITEPEPGACRTSVIATGAGSPHAHSFTEDLMSAIKDHFERKIEKDGVGVCAMRVGENHGKEKN